MKRWLLEGFGENRALSIAADILDCVRMVQMINFIHEPTLDELRRATYMDKASFIDWADSLFEDKDGLGAS